MAETRLVGVNTIKVGSYIVIEGAACKVTNIQVSKPGKHGHAKYRIEAVGLLDGRKRTVIIPGGDNVEVPIIEKKGAQVLSIAGNKATVMDNETFETFELDIPEELKDDVVEGCKIVYWDILGQKVIKQVKGE
ncbi:translation initiation factor IF-5A [Candidatus Woesearchaeota archaeon]|nr:translation initiation factor IF-5A [Candidatus Woesearchaeota archaeon]RLE40481.1 MAG: translation initiation factor IF-5A [Candidatus Woesearchaeota archaeon]